MSIQATNPIVSFTVNQTTKKTERAYMHRDCALAIFNSHQDLSLFASPCFLCDQKIETISNPEPIYLVEEKDPLGVAITLHIHAYCLPLHISKRHCLRCHEKTKAVENAPISKPSSHTYLSTRNPFHLSAKHLRESEMRRASFPGNFSIEESNLSQLEKPLDSRTRLSSYPGTHFQKEDLT